MVDPTGFDARSEANARDQQFYQVLRERGVSRSRVMQSFRQDGVVATLGLIGAALQTVAEAPLPQRPAFTVTDIYSPAKPLIDTAPPTVQQTTDNPTVTDGGPGFPGTDGDYTIHVEGGAVSYTPGEWVEVDLCDTTTGETVTRKVFAKIES